MAFRSHRQPDAGRKTTGNMWGNSAIFASSHQNHGTRQVGDMGFQSSTGIQSEDGKTIRREFLEVFFDVTCPANRERVFRSCGRFGRRRSQTRRTFSGEQHGVHTESRCRPDTGAQIAGVFNGCGNKDDGGRTILFSSQKFLPNGSPFFQWTRFAKSQYALMRSFKPGIELFHRQLLDANAEIFGLSLQRMEFGMSRTALQNQIADASWIVFEQGFDGVQATCQAGWINASWHVLRIPLPI